MIHKILLIFIAVLIVLAMIIPVAIGRFANDPEKDKREDPDDEN